ncbi:4377_t:CDS:2, partial [Gigaspora rosea]
MSTNINLDLTKIYYSLFDLLDKPHQRLPVQRLSVVRITGTNSKGINCLSNLRFDLQKVDLASIEDGLDGRLDTTNEKVDIMKTGCKAVIAPQIERAAKNILKKYFEHQWIPLQGDFQLENAATAVLASDLLRKRKSKFSIIANYREIACASGQ